MFLTFDNNASGNNCPGIKVCYYRMCLPISQCNSIEVKAATQKRKLILKLQILGVNLTNKMFRTIEDMPPAGNMSCVCTPFSAALECRRESEGSAAVPLLSCCTFRLTQSITARNENTNLKIKITPTSVPLRG